jgi:PIN domain nuclease of toxin-antitoxin system
MRLLLDTHVFLWVLGEPARLSARTMQIMADDSTAVHVSIISLWEIVLKQRVGKLEADIPAILEQLASPEGKIDILDVAPAHLLALARLPTQSKHRDPFDHLLISQAIAENMTLVTDDQYFRIYQVALLQP